MNISLVVCVIWHRASFVFRLLDRLIYRLSVSQTTLVLYPLEDKTSLCLVKLEFAVKRHKLLLTIKVVSKVLTIIRRF